MKRSEVMSALGIVVIIMLSLVNVSHSIWTVWLVLEQIKTGWGMSTEMEMFVLWPWTVELFCSPVLLGGIVHSIVAIFKRPKKGIFIAELILLGLAFAQYGITNLFIWF